MREGLYQIILFSLVTSFRGCKVLIVRKAINDSWARYGVPSLSSDCIHISFEAIVSAFGGKTPFNSLVGELVNFDYYEKWIV